jgi:hypothetical protein
MKLTIKDLYQDKDEHLSGTPEDVRSQLLTLYPFLLTRFGPHCDIDILVDALNRSQCCFVVENDPLGKSEYHGSAKHGQLYTVDEQLEALRAAAAFLAGHPCSDKEMRQALIQSDADPALAVLRAHGLSPDLLPDLVAVANASQQLEKSEEDSQPISFSEVSPSTASAKAFADAVKAASEEGDIRPISFGKSKHGKGMFLAHVAGGASYILKPGSGKQNPVTGESESGSTQSQREAAFYSVAVAFGLGEYLPECHLLLIDGIEYACMVMLPRTFKNFNEIKAKDPNLPKRLLHLYNDGTLHKWATLDFVGGNPDRNAGNLMASGDTVKLIDHGSTFAGAHFDPAKDGISFTPYYLRPGVKGFQDLTAEQKLRVMPRLTHQNEHEFKKWLSALIPSTLTQCLTQYGIESSPSLARLRRLQEATAYQSADLAVLSAWVVY